MPDEKQPQLPPPTGWMSAKGAGEFLGLSPITVRNLVRNKVLDPGYIGTNLYVSEVSVRRYAKERKPSHRPKSKSIK
jgi:hypothetical protein